MADENMDGAVAEATAPVEETTEVITEAIEGGDAQTEVTDGDSTSEETPVSETAGDDQQEELAQSAG